MPTQIALVDQSQLLADADVYLVNASRVDVVFTLPDPRSTQGRRIIVKKTDTSANAVRIVALGGMTKVDTALEYTLTAPQESVHIESDGRAYWVLKSHRPGGGGGGAGDVTGAANVGTGSASFKNEVAGVLNFRRIQAGANVAVVENADEIVISALGGGGGAATHTHQHEEFLDAGPAAVALLATPDSASDAVWLNGVKLRRVNFFTGGPNEYTLSTNTITLWAPRFAGDWLDVTYTTSVVSTHTHQINEYTSGGPTFTLGFMPTTGSDEAYLNGVKQRRGGLGLNQYTISGNVVTLWTSLLPGDVFQVLYRV